MFSKEGRKDLVEFIKLYVKIYESQTNTKPDFEKIKEVFKVSGIKVSDSTIVRVLNGE
ncbi:hypothetical protein ACFVS2_25990 [Brevibacillus sp. NPDC058079]|uniref:hypothetical protein n=1 Tax=Brevibacillus sp. NPDC058079 TaxID=3346330 RepID=UPI0036E22ECE